MLTNEGGDVGGDDSGSGGGEVVDARRLSFGVFGLAAVSGTSVSHRLSNAVLESSRQFRTYLIRSIASFRRLSVSVELLLLPPGFSFVISVVKSSSRTLIPSSRIAPKTVCRSILSVHRLRISLCCSPTPADTRLTSPIASLSALLTPHLSDLSRIFEATSCIKLSILLR